MVFLNCFDNEKKSLELYARSKNRNNKINIQYVGLYRRLCGAVSSQVRLRNAETAYYYKER